MVNRVILAGHCTRDTVAIATQGKPMARMRLATNSVWRDANGDLQEATEYHSIVLFGRLAEVAREYAVKGAPCTSRAGSGPATSPMATATAGSAPRSSPRR